MNPVFRIHPLAEKRTHLLCSAFVALQIAGAQAITIETVPVGNPGNPGEGSGEAYGGCGETEVEVGAVPYTYHIGKYEVTNAQYAAFLNAVDPGGSNPRNLYSSSMLQTGTSGQFGISLNTGGLVGSKYAVVPGSADLPVVYVTLWDALRFANWMHNGQGNGDTESGAYDLKYGPSNGGTDEFTPANRDRIIRSRQARWFVPTEDEWYKAAYHKNDGPTGNFWQYPTRSDQSPQGALSPGASSPDPTNVANIDGVLGTAPTPYAPVGSYPQAPGPYGTFDQAGNVWEWTIPKAFIGSWGAHSYYSVVRGGAYSEYPQVCPGLPANNRGLLPQEFSISYGGFRLAHQPDTDGDGMHDRYEEENGLDRVGNDASGDADGDGRTNLQEFEDGTDADNSDTDGDGLEDGVETNTGIYLSSTNTGSNPLEPDSDDDGLDDGVETGTGNYLDQDHTGTSPVDADSDKDGHLDGIEVQRGTDPTDPLSPVLAVVFAQDFESGLGSTESVAGNWHVNSVHPVLNNGTNMMGHTAAYGPVGSVTTPSENLDAHYQFTVDLRGYEGGFLVFDIEAELEQDYDGFNVHASASGQFPNAQSDPWPTLLTPAVTSELEYRDMWHDLGTELIGWSSPVDGQVYSMKAVFDLSGFDDQEITIRFRFGADSNWGGEGVNFDNIVVKAVALADTDSDGMYDRYEIANGLDPEVDDAAGDLDSDGLDNLSEFQIGSDPRDPDTDNDGLLDGVETNTGTFVSASNTGTSPLAADTDGDRIDDATEVAKASDPNDADSLPNGTPILGWTAEGLPLGTLLEWAPAANRTGNSGIILNRGSGAKVETGVSNFINVNSWVATPRFTFFDPVSGGNPASSWEAALGDPATKDNASWELVMRPGDFVGEHVLFTTGVGGSGTAIILLGSRIEFRFQSAADPAQRIIVGADLAKLGSPASFFHVVGVADVTSGPAGTGRLYINGQPATDPVTSSGPIDDWAGVASSFLDWGVAPGNPIVDRVRFTGDLAAFRYHGGQVLGPDTVLELYEDLAGGTFVPVVDECHYDQGTDQVHLGWSARSGAIYALSWSPDLHHWETNLGYWFAASGDRVTTGSFANPAAVGAVRPDKLFFRVAEIAPPAPDRDGDGIPDHYELANGLDPDVDDADSNLDGDTLSNREEFARGTAADKTDTDGDGLTDDVETGRGIYADSNDTGTDPRSSDTDGDGLSDKVETNTGIFAGLTDTGTDPFRPDSDGDGLLDGSEVSDRTDPHDPNDPGFWRVRNATSSTPLESNADARDLFDGLNLISETDTQERTINFVDNTDPLYPNPRPFPLLGSFNQDADDFALLATGTLVVRTAGEYTFGFNSDDGGGLWIDGRPVVDFDFTRPSATSLGSIFLPRGIHDVEFLFWERRFGAQVQVFAHNDIGDFTKPPFVAADYHLLHVGTRDPSDSDGDSLPDQWERLFFGGLAEDASGDPDGDQLTTREEFEQKTDPLLADTDRDGLADGVEDGGGIFVSASQTGTSPLVPDSDGDGLSDDEEVSIHGTDPNKRDTDGDGADDALELQFGGNPSEPLVLPDVTATVGVFHGGDRGEGLDLDGTFLHAVNVSSSGPAGRVRDADFTGDETTSGVTVIAANDIPAWGPAMNFGDSRNDDALENVMAGIRWSLQPEGVVIRMENLVPGTRYRLQTLHAEKTSDRGFDVLLNGALVIDDFNPGRVQLNSPTVGGDAGTTNGAVVTIEFAAPSDVIEVELNGRESPFRDQNAILDGFTLEILPPDTDRDGLPDAWELQYFADLSQDGSEDPDGDRLTTFEEVGWGTNPTVADTDGDGLSDRVEDGSGIFVSTSRTGTDARNPDTDGDGQLDGAEVTNGSDPTDPSDGLTPKPTLGWSAASLPVGALATWTPAVNDTGNNGISFTGGSGGTVRAGTSNLMRVSSWVNSPNYEFFGNPGDSWQESLGDPITKESVSWELVFRPGDFVGDHVLFNTGGNGFGTAFVLAGSTLEFRFQSADSLAQRVTVSVDLSTLGGSSEFYHVVGVADLQSSASGTGWLYVNGDLVDGPTISSGIIDDWDGGDTAELGTGVNFPNDTTMAPVPFTGDIAAFHYYGRQTLGSLEVAKLHADLNSEPEEIRVTSYHHDSATDRTTLEWTAEHGAIYAIDWSTDLVHWKTNLSLQVAATGPSASHGPFVDPTGPAGHGSSRVFFRVRLVSSSAVDRDSDGISDFYELTNGLDPLINDAAGDLDGDGLSNLDEFARGTDANNRDTDGDGVDDGVESDRGFFSSASDTGSSPLVTDTDGDGIPDGAESGSGVFSDAGNTGTDPTEVDSDGDGINDGLELAQGSDPTDPASLPTAPAGAILYEDFDGLGSNSTFSLFSASGTPPAFIDRDGGRALRMSHHSNTNNNSVAWDSIALPGDFELSFLFRMSDDAANTGCCNEAADGFGFGLFDTSVHGAVGPLDPALLDADWEDPTARSGIQNALYVGFDIFQANNVRVTGPGGATDLIGDITAPFTLNNGQFHKVRLSVSSGQGGTIFSLHLVEDVLGQAVEHRLVDQAVVPGFDLSSLQTRLAMGGRTGGAHVETDLDDILITSGGEAITITNVAPDLGQKVLAVTWRSEEGRIYEVLASETAEPGSWVSVDAAVPGALGSDRTSHEVPIPGGAIRLFVQVRSNPSP